MEKKRKRTDKSKYKHKSTGEYCTCAAYVSEIMCQRKAQFKNEGSLPFKFWNNKAWKPFFLHQMTLANRLIKKYSEIALVRAVQSKDWDKANIFSLKHPKATGIVNKYQLLLNEESNSKQKINTFEDATQRKKRYSKKKNNLKSLRKFENGKEEKNDQ
tara:strand:+ start:315 stop:788 length:474 start_codon:yes stop_codon:yes gene_type:complete